MAENELVSVENLHLMFQVRMRHNSSLRDRFVDGLRHPIESLVRKQEVNHVLRGLNFTASRGDRIAIIGLNGAGKSTLCRCLTGTFAPNQGRISVKGTIRAILDPGAIIFPELTGRENARILAQLIYSEEALDLDSTLKEALEFSGLGKYLDTAFRYYSTGMQSRLCLSVATCRPADVFILDEVFDGADAEFRERISERILNLIARSGVVFFVSHSEEQVRRVCNKALLLHGGQILGFGGLDQVYDQYHSIVREQVSRAQTGRI